MSRYLLFALVSLPLVLASISSTSVAVAFPVMTSSFNASLILAGWVLSIYQLVFTAAMPLAGKASDVLGRKNTFLLCLSFFCLGSFLCAVSPNIYFLIMARFIQALGGGGFMPAATGIVSDAFPDKRQQAIGLFTSIHPVGQIIGPALGGWLVTVFGWQMIFWFNVPIAIIIMIGTALAMHPEPRRETRIDLAGSGLFTCSIFAFMISLSTMGNIQSGLSWVLIAILLIASATFMVYFIRRARKVDNPIIDPVVLQNKPFVAANVYNFILGACYIGVSSLLPLYVVSVYGLSILESGLILTPKAIGMLVASTVTSFYLVGWGYRLPMLAGTAVILLTLIIMGLELPGLNLPGLQLSSTGLILVIMALIGFGMGTVAPAANNACIELMPERVGTITGIRGMFRQTGGAISIAAATLLLNNVGDMARGFHILFFALAATMTIAVPFIFLMPRDCKTTRSATFHE